MKTKILLLALLLLPSVAIAQETRSQAAQSLTQLGMSPELSQEVAGLATGLGVVPNNTYIKARNAADSANINLVGTNASNQVNVAPDSTLILNANNGATYYGSGLYASGAVPLLGIDTVDGTDNKSISLVAGTAASSGRGAFVTAHGNETGNTGLLSLTSGSASGANVNIETASSNGVINLRANGSARWVMEADGDLTSQATNGGDLNISALGKTISIQESTPGSACAGSFTANGATPVVVSTTCAATVMRTLFTKTSTSAVNGSCYRSAISNGVSFTVTCLASDTGTYDWFIIKEAP